MKLAIFAIVALAAVAAARPAMRQATFVMPEFPSFAMWQQMHAKAYLTAGESTMREAVYAVNVEIARRHNADPSSTYKMGVNQFSDLTK